MSISVKRHESKAHCIGPTQPAPPAETCPEILNEMRTDTKLHQFIGVNDAVEGRVLYVRLPRTWQNGELGPFFIGCTDIDQAMLLRAVISTS